MSINSQPTLNTERLKLRPFTSEDAGDVKQLAGDRDVASTTLLIPHPYPDGAAENWIRSQADLFQKRRNVVFAITRVEDQQLVGAIGLVIQSIHNRGELGYWVGKPFWGQGHCTEAAQAVLAFGFKELELNRIYAHHMQRNPASGRVMEKLGMRYEGLMRQHFKKWDQYEDMLAYGLLREEFDALGQ
jgi:ribosomal-protein-alanine N-acetyltransferase